MNNTNSRQQRLAGFTIVELMLATSVFSVVLLVALTSFLQVGHLFYKGVSLTNTQNVATSVLNDVSNSVQNASTISSSTPYTSGTYDYLCAGNTRYTFTTHNVNGQQVSVAASLSTTPNYNSGDNGGNFGLLKDSLPGSSGCAAPCASGCGSAGFDQTKPVEMLGDQMRLASITITNVPTVQNLYNIKMVMAYGDDTFLNFSIPRQPVCTGSSANQAFCSVVSLSTSVFAGVRS